MAANQRRTGEQQAQQQQQADIMSCTQGGRKIIGVVASSADACM
jgi:hypothetical protein